MVPKLQIHKHAKRWMVKIDGKFVYLGKWDGEKKPPLAVQAKYQEAIRIKLYPEESFAKSLVSAGKVLTVTEAVVMFLEDIESRRGVKAAKDHKHSLMQVVEMFGVTFAKDFGALRLEAVRDELVRLGRTRSGINVAVNRIRTCFSWLASREIIPGETLAKQRALVALRKGQTEAPESKPKATVEPELAEQTAGKAHPVLAAMIRVQLATGMRPGELCAMTPGQIDTKDPECWFYRPEKFKTAHLDKNRSIPLGPQVQGILAPLLENKGPNVAIFSPKEAIALQNQQKRLAAKSPSPISRAKDELVKPPRAFYDTQSYGRAIARLCDAHGLPRWSPSCLRATRAQFVFEAEGLEATKHLLGHSDTEVTKKFYLHQSEAIAKKLTLKLENPK